MSDNQSEAIDQFVSLTQATETQAKFFLEMSNWDLQVAITQYFESNNGGGNTLDEHLEEQANSPAPTPSSPYRSTKGKASGSSSKIRTFRDLSNDMDEESNSGDDEHENLYAGGEKSGMVVQGPNKKGNNIVDDILKKAAEGGQAHEERMETKKKPNYYTGAGYRLGSEDEPSSVSRPVTTATPAQEELEPVTRHLTFWRNGFSVDDGRLYEYTDPANQEMLTAINSGRAPLSLLNVRHGQPVEVRVIKRQDEDYRPPPKAAPKPFEGAGHRLGSPAPIIEPSPTPGAFPSSSSQNSAPTVDESQPVTSIQIRLGDGSRLIAKLNHTHTIGDIRQYIEANHTSSHNRQYILQTTFPVKQLEDNNQTIKEAGLLNSVIVQRYQ
ncbi:hypothetical protein G6F48_011067 [Rhizopus delemar]|nr:hypothetical protein G6F43_004356 [Rhizopus delemar]KAG1579561.1 hypothetical protein G6F48_011067 [Rhizopus delemar]